MAQNNSWSYDNWDGGTRYDQSPVADAPVNVRAEFIRKTYLTLGGALLAFGLLTSGLVYSGVAHEIVQSLFRSKGGVIALMVLFVVGGMGAHAMARSRSSVGLQWLGLVLYTLLEVAIFLPILVYAELRFPGQPLALQAGLCTLMVFGALTFAVVATGKDFSFLRPFLLVASVAAIGFIIASVFMGFSLGLVFIVAMLLLMSGYILYETSNVMQHYQPGTHVAAALALFAAVATMFYWMIRLFMNQGSRD